MKQPKLYIQKYLNLFGRILLVASLISFFPLILAMMNDDYRGFTP